jgi:hypothetical protein
MYVTQEGVTPSQPHIGVGTISPARPDGTGFRLSIHRFYNDLSNEWGGMGRLKPLDGNGLIFDTREQAQQWTVDHGYVRPYFTSPSLRAERKRRAQERPYSR